MCLRAIYKTVFAAKKLQYIKDTERIANGYFSVKDF